MIKAQVDDSVSLKSIRLLAKDKISNQNSARPILEKCEISSIMNTYSSNSHSSQPSPAFLSGKYANDTNKNNSKSKNSSPSHQVQSSNSFNSYYGSSTTAGNATGTANALLNGTVKVSVLSMKNES